MLYREGEYDEDCENPGLTNVLIRKNRYGPKADVELAFDRKQMSFGVILSKRSDSGSEGSSPSRRDLAQELLELFAGKLDYGFKQAIGLATAARRG